MEACYCLIIRATEEEGCKGSNAQCKGTARRLVQVLSPKADSLALCIWFAPIFHRQETKARLQRQIANLRKAEEDSRTSLARSEAARSDQERRLEAASSQWCRGHAQAMLPA
eukprot:1158835-Pelagomonas_calceolata.AAC.21